VDADEREIPVAPADGGGPHVGDSQIARPGRGVDVILWPLVQIAGHSPLLLSRQESTASSPCLVHSSPNAGPGAYRGDRSGFPYLLLPPSTCGRNHEHVPLPFGSRRHSLPEPTRPSMDLGFWRMRDQYARKATESPQTR